MVAQIGRQGNAARLLDNTLQGLRIAVEHGDPRTLGGKQPAGCRPDAGGAAGDENTPPAKTAIGNQ